MGVSSGMELLTLPHGRQLRLDLLERCVENRRRGFCHQWLQWHAGCKCQNKKSTPIKLNRPWALAQLEHDYTSGLSLCSFAEKQQVDPQFLILIPHCSIQTKEKHPVHMGMKEHCDCLPHDMTLGAWGQANFGCQWPGQGESPWPCVSSHILTWCPWGSLQVIGIAEYTALYIMHWYKLPSWIWITFKVQRWDRYREIRRERMQESLFIKCKNELFILRNSA